MDKETKINVIRYIIVIIIYLILVLYYIYMQQIPNKL